MQAETPVPLWTVEDLATYLGVPVSTVYRWRHRGEGPPGYKVGKRVRFRAEDIEGWLAERRNHNPG